MKDVLVDTSVWIEYFKGDPSSDAVDDLIDTNLVCVNDLILTELIPYLEIRKQSDVAALLRNLRTVPLDIDWIEIQAFQIRNLKKGLNHVGIPDLIILQNVIQNDIHLYSFDRHSNAMQDLFAFNMFNMDAGKGKKRVKAVRKKKRNKKGKKKK